MGGQISLTASLIMIGLFTIAIIGFAVNFAIDNDSAIDIADDSQLYSLYTNTNQNISNLGGDNEEQLASILETTISPGSDSPQSAGPFSLTYSNSLGVVKNIMEVGYIKIFGSGSGFGIFLTTFIGFIGFLFGLYIYKTLRGQPD